MKKCFLRILSVILVLLLSVTSCKKNDANPKEQILGVRDQFSDSLRSVRFYRSDALPGEAGYTDQGLIASLLGNGKDYPPEMAGVSEYAFLCASQIEICEVWAIKCRTHSSAKKIYVLLEKRKERISALNYESEYDTEAASHAHTAINGKNVYFAATKNAEQIIRYLLDG